VVNLNITLPDELHKSLKIKALQKDTTLKDLIVELLEEWVKHET